MQKLLQESKNVEYESEENEGTTIFRSPIQQITLTNYPRVVPVSVLGVKRTSTLDLALAKIWFALDKDSAPFRFPF